MYKGGKTKDYRHKNNKLREQRLNQESNNKKIFKWTLQQQKWYKNGAYIGYGKQKHFIKNY